MCRALLGVTRATESVIMSGKDASLMHVVYVLTCHGQALDTAPWRMGHQSWLAVHLQEGVVAVGGGNLIVLIYSHDIWCGMM